MVLGAPRPLQCLAHGRCPINICQLFVGSGDDVMGDIKAPFGNHILHKKEHLTSCL